MNGKKFSKDEKVDNLSALGYICYLKGDLSEAEKCLEQAVNLDDKNVINWKNLALIYKKLKKWDKLIFCFKKVLEIDPELIDAWNNLGYGYGMLKEYKKELECYDRVLELNSESEDGWFNKGVVFEYNLTNETFTVIHIFEESDMGRNPYGSLIQAADGKLYGITNLGGTSDYGVLFEYDLINNLYTKKLNFDGSNNGRLPFIADGLLQYSCTQCQPNSISQ